MPLPTINIKRTSGNIGRNGVDSGEGVGALCMGGVAVVGGAQLNTNYKLFSLNAADEIGLDAAYDTANNVLVYHHIDEFFAKNPTGELHIRLVAQGTTLADMCDKTETHLKALLAAGEGKIRKAGVVLATSSG